MFYSHMKYSMHIGSRVPVKENWLYYNPLFLWPHKFFYLSYQKLFLFKHCRKVQVAPQWKKKFSAKMGQYCAKICQNCAKMGINRAQATHILDIWHVYGAVWRNICKINQIFCKFFAHSRHNSAQQWRSIAQSGHNLA